MDRIWNEWKREVEKEHQEIYMKKKKEKKRRRRQMKNSFRKNNFTLSNQKVKKIVVEGHENFEQSECRI